MTCSHQSNARRVKEMITAEYKELQYAFAEMDDQFSEHRAKCRNIAQALRENLADYLGLHPSEIRFITPDELDQVLAVGTAKPNHFNDAFEAGQLTSGGVYRIGLCFGVSPDGETEPVWYPLVPIKLVVESKKLSLEVERTGFTFELGARSNLRPVSEFIVKHWRELAHQEFSRFCSRARKREIGYHTLLSNRRNLEFSRSECGGI